MEDQFNIDHDREGRLGFPEIIFGATKSTKVLRRILNSYQENNQNALVTKMESKKADKLFNKFPRAFYDPDSGIFILDFDEDEIIDGSIAIISAGTSDIYIVNEVYYTLAYLGIKSERIHDVGVSGVHRLMTRIEDLKKFKVLIVVAGFEGALPTVVGGLLPQPIIAVPTSIGYGVAKDGNVALNTMLSSCANGITVVNIDNGYGAAMAAYRILKQF